LKYATEVINSNHFRFVTGAEVNLDETNINSDMTFTREHIFSIYVSGLKQLSDVTFKNNSPDPLALGNSIDLADLYSTRAKLDAMFEQSVAGYGTDIRGTSGATGSTGTTGVKTLWYQFNTNIVYAKKFWADNETNVKQRLIPLIKLAEMYYIAAEAAATPEEGVVFLNTVRTARLIPALPATITAANLDAELLKEYRKESYGEGQLWFYYKRKNTTTIPDGVGNPMTAAKYVFPYPQTEIEFGK
jgi:starch-binding outer membrane protein, SusD/RagB family